MKIGDIITLNEINKWKKREYYLAFNSARFSKKDGKAWWNRTKKNILNNTKFKVIQLPNQLKEEGAK